MTSVFIPTTPKWSPDQVIHARITRPPPDEVSSKPLLILLHYWGGTASTWDRLTQPGSPTSLGAIYPTLAIDLRGWGRSDWPAEGSESTTPILDMANDVAIVLESLKEDDNAKDIFDFGIVLVGHSMGAKVALASLSTLSPEMVNLLKGLVLIAPAPPTPLVLPPEMTEQQLQAYSSVESIEWTMENVLANTEKMADSDLDMVVRDSWGGRSAAKKMWPGVGMQEDVSEVVSSALRGHSSLRASVLVGEFDVVEPKERVEAEVVRFLTANGCEVNLTTVEGVKHLIPLEGPKSIYQEIRRLF